jgi:heme a synthase
MVNKWVKYWLFTGLVMIFIQVVVGGITRLTESGLSITKWEIIAGTLPPLTDDAWSQAFDLYKATPQYKEINEGMDISDFKFIYFWEWVHRFWARWMGFVFIIPFVFFVAKSWLDRGTIMKLGVVILLAVCAATFGWIMVASGLINRPWVNAYKLSFHLCIAFSVYAYLLYTYLSYVYKSEGKTISKINKRYVNYFLFFICVLWAQLFFGGVMSGMKAGVYFPTWPDINGEYIPQVIFNSSEWNVENFNQYDRNVFMPSLVQFIHRSTAYLLIIIGLFIFVKAFRSGFFVSYKREILIFMAMLIIQVLLGIITLLLCKGEVPVLWGVAHQAGALLLLTVTMWTRFKINLE